MPSKVTLETLSRFVPLNTTDVPNGPLLGENDSIEAIEARGQGPTLAPRDSTVTFTHGSPS